MCLGLHVEYNLFLLHFNGICFFSRFSKKKSNIRFNENPFSGSRAVSCGRTDRHDEDNSRFSQFVSVRKNGNLMRTNHYEAKTLSALHEIRMEWYLLE
jgi:hypothetical protein